MVLALGEYPADRLPAGERQALASMLLAWYRKDPDPGFHGGIDWLLWQTWGQEREQLDGIDQILKQLDDIDRELTDREPPEGRHWYVNGQRQTFAVVRGPVEFRMGSPETEADRDANEIPHDKRIERSFAIATKLVTVGQYTRFLEESPGVANKPEDDPQFKPYMRTPDYAMSLVDWYNAARYCNWLSQKEGIPEDQWCYPEKIGPGMTLPADHLERTGYRLPTEAEWEYACAPARRQRDRMAVRRRCCRSTRGINQTRGACALVGGKKPNDLGLFDVWVTLGSGPWIPTGLSTRSGKQSICGCIKAGRILESSLPCPPGRLLLPHGAEPPVGEPRLAPANVPLHQLRLSPREDLPLTPFTFSLCLPYWQ